jgi:hypothetical protein
MRLAVIFLVWSAAAAIAGPAAQLPELWIAPQRYSVGVDEPVVADLRRGNAFQGDLQGFAMAGLRRFEIWSGETRESIEGADGALPAVSLVAPGEGLAILVHESAGPAMAWSDWQAFESFVRTGDFAWALADHRDRGLPLTGFRMACTRFAKTLVAVGDGIGADRAIGLEVEIVALVNPYTDDLGNGIPVRVLYQGKPRKSMRVTLDMRFPDGSLRQRVGWTDVDGKLRLPAVPGAEYLVNAVVLRPLPGSTTGVDPVWETLWASLVFRAPE